MDLTAVLLLCILVAIVTAAVVSRPHDKSQEQVQAELLLEEVHKEAIKPFSNVYDMKKMTTWRDPETGNTHICSVEEALKRQDVIDGKDLSEVDKFVTQYCDGLVENE